MKETLIRSVCYLVGTLWRPLPRRRAHLVTLRTADTIPTGLPLTAIHGIPMNPLVKS